ncbi:MAG: cyclase family protein [Planctomycetota bacterium]
MTHTRQLLTSLLIAGALSACQAPERGLGPGRWIDLTHAFDESTVYWPTADGFELTIDSQGMTEKGFWYEANSFRSAEHGGTHLDAPVHFAEGKETVDEIPLGHLIGPGVVVDVEEACSSDRDYQVTVQDFEAFEARHGELPAGSIVLLRTGFARHWPDREKYMGTAERGAEAVTKLHFPGLHPDAARWLLANRDIHAIGLDTPSIDFGQSTLFESHQILFAENVPAFENVAHLDQLPAQGFLVVALPMKIRDGSGGPLRIVAFVGE